jgi:hypothetical protein
LIPARLKEQGIDHAINAAVTVSIASQSMVERESSQNQVNGTDKGDFKQ